MNLEDFRIKFFAETETLFNRYAKDKVFENENFLNLLALNSCNRLYGLVDKYYLTTTFQCICNLFSSLEYDIYDDGMVSMFIYTIEHNYADDFSKVIKKEKCSTTEYKIIGGEFGYSLTEEKLIQITEKEYVHPIYKSQKLVSWKLTRFDWDSLKFLTSFVPEYEKMIEISEEESRNPKPKIGFNRPGWFDMKEKIEEKIINYFSEKPYMTSERWASGQKDFLI